VTSAADEIEPGDEAEGSHNSSDDAMVVDSGDEPSHDHDVGTVDETSAATGYISPAGTDDSAALSPPPSVPGAASALVAANDTASTDCSVLERVVSRDDEERSGVAEEGLHKVAV